MLNCAKKIFLLHLNSCKISVKNHYHTLRHRLSICVAKTKAKSTQLMCTFVFAYADWWFSGAAAQLILEVRGLHKENCDILHFINSLGCHRENIFKLFNLKAFLNLVIANKYHSSVLRSFLDHQAATFIKLPHIKVLD